MATEDQVQQLIDILNRQMTTVLELQADNTRLREDAVNSNGAGNNGEGNNVTNATRSRYKSKKPDRPFVEGGMDDREWALFNDTSICATYK